MTDLGVVIVDDEHLARRGLALRLANIEGVALLAECGNGETALEAVAQHSPDILFLDIEMPGMSGLEVVGRLQGDNMPLVIFVTAYNEFAVEAFRVNAIDYVLKPLEEDRLREAVERARGALEQKQAAVEKTRLLSMVLALEEKQPADVVEPTAGSERASKLLIRDAGEVSFIPMHAIEWIDAAGDYMCVHAEGETHIMRSTMKQLQEQLDPEVFARIHRSTIVNVDRIASAQSLASGEYRLTLDSGQQLKVSRGYRDVAKRIVGKDT